MSRRLGLKLFLSAASVVSLVGCGGDSETASVPASQTSSTPPTGGMTPPGGSSSGGESSSSGGTSSGGEVSSSKSSDDEEVASSGGMSPPSGGSSSSMSGMMSGGGGRVAEGETPPGPAAFGPGGAEGESSSSSSGTSSDGSDEEDEAAQYARRMKELGNGGGMTPPPMAAGGTSSGGGNSMDMSIGEGGAAAGGMQPGGFGGNQFQAPIGPEKPAEDADYLTKAKYAFSIGREPDAYKFLHAHIIWSDTDSDELLKQMQFCKDLTQPAAGIKFALGLDLKAPANITDYKPVGSNVGGGGGGMDGMLGPPGFPGSGGGGGGGGAAKGDPRLYERASGQMGRSLVNMFESKYTEGKFGSVFSDAENVAGSIDDLPPAAGGGGAGMGGFGGGPQEPSSFGGSSPMAAGGMFGGAPRKRVPGIGIRFTPGLSYIGSGTLPELKGKAIKDGFDYLFIVDVQVTMSRRGSQVENDTRATLFNLKTNKAVAVSKRLNNIAYQKAVEKGDSGDIDSSMVPMFNKIDELVALAPMPNVKAESIKNRVSTLIKNKEADVLRALAEIRLWHSLKLMTDDEKNTAFALLVDGADGETLATGDEGARREILDKMVPKQ